MVILMVNNENKPANRLHTKISRKVPLFLIFLFFITSHIKVKSVATSFRVRKRAWKRRVSIPKKGAVHNSMQMREESLT